MPNKGSSSSSMNRSSSKAGQVGLLKSLKILQSAKQTGSIIRGRPSFRQQQQQQQQQ
jgi:hypothetical protein